jgi:hypothetical protein
VSAEASHSVVSFQKRIPVREFNMPPAGFRKFFEIACGDAGSQKNNASPLSFTHHTTTVARLSAID